MIGGPKTPTIEPPRTPPPPPPALPPPGPAQPEVQAAGADVRRAFRRRGRASTVLTPGGGAGVLAPVTSARKTLLGQ